MAKVMSDADIAAYKDKAATAVQTRYADWLIEKLDLEFPNTKAEAAFREAVRLSTALRMIFQASPENQGARAEARTEDKADKKSKAKAEQADESDDETPAPKKRGRPAKAAKPTPVDDEDSGDEAVAPAPKASKPTKAAARSKGNAAPF
jgi:hypothetical protein